MTAPGQTPIVDSVRNFLSLLLALLILVVFGGVAFFLWNTSAKAEFERLDKNTAPAE